MIGAALALTLASRAAPVVTAEVERAVADLARAVRATVPKEADRILVTGECGADTVGSSLAWARPGASDPVIDARDLAGFVGDVCDAFSVRLRDGQVFDVVWSFRDGKADLAVGPVRMRSEAAALDDQARIRDFFLVLGA